MPIAAGNLLHGVEKADTAAREGRHVAECIVSYLSTNLWPTNNRILIEVNTPLVWISPNIIVPENNTHLPLNHFTFRARGFLGKTTIEVWQGEKLLHSQIFRKLIPNRWYHLESHWVSQLSPKQDNNKIKIQSV